MQRSGKFNRNDGRPASANAGSRRCHDRGVVTIAVFKVMKGLLLLVVGVGLLRLVHAEVATWFSILLESLRLNAESRWIHALILKVDALQPHTLMVGSLVSLGYGALLLVEGVGLWCERAWAAYLTVVSTSLFLPVELYEIYERTTLSRLAILGVNVAILVYLVSQLKWHQLQSAPHRGDARP